MTITFNNGSSGSCNNSGIKSLVINAAGHLIVTYTDNTIQDLGLVVGQNGENGKNFYPNEIGFEVPSDKFKVGEQLGWCYLSLANNTSTLYFKSNDAQEQTSTWISVEFGKGDTGEAGKPFHIDSAGTTFPSSGLFDNYTFYNTQDGKLYFYQKVTATWSDGIPFRGEQGPRGRFHIDGSGDQFPSIENLPIDYCFYNNTDGKLYYVDEVTTTTPPSKEWSSGILFRGKEGPQGIQGNQGEPGAPGKDTISIRNIIDHSWTNALLVIGTCPAGYVVSNIDVNILQPYSLPVTDMFVRFGGEANENIGGTVIAPISYFDINRQMRFIVNETNHEVSDVDEIISCIFNDSVNNSPYGKMEIICTLSWQAPVQPIQDNI